MLVAAPTEMIEVPAYLLSRLAEQRSQGHCLDVEDKGSLSIAEDRVPVLLSKTAVDCSKSSSGKDRRPSSDVGPNCKCLAGFYHTTVEFLPKILDLTNILMRLSTSEVFECTKVQK